MKKRFTQLWNSGKQTVSSQTDRALEQRFAGQVVNALTFIVIIFCLGLWIIAFLLLKDRLFTDTFSGKILTDLTCITFFCGLGIAIVAGALASNFLRRAFWKLLINRANRK